MIKDSVVLKSLCEAMRNTTLLDNETIVKIAFDCYSNLYETVVNTQNYLKLPVALIFDVPGGRLVPMQVMPMPGQQRAEDNEEDDFIPEEAAKDAEDIAREIFTEIWGCTPTKEDIEKIKNILINR